ncbi:Cytochrome [Aphelenchoides besseyi]|nr:Cytochrome [Aphelenchoides besseyi]
MSTPEGDYEKRKNFKDLCSKCHDVFSNAKMTGPTLNGVVGRLGGQIRKFKCSSAMMKKVSYQCGLLANQSISECHLDAGNALRVLERSEEMDQQRADLIKFLRQETSIHILPPPPAKQANQSPIGQFATYYLAVGAGLTVYVFSYYIQWLLNYLHGRK